MQTVNRFALIVKPDKPYIEWAAKVFDEPESKVRKEIAEQEPSIYLLPESAAPDAEYPTLLKPFWRGIFKEELEGWCTNEDTWPKNRSEKLFREWFKLQLCTLVFDLSKDKLIHEK